MTNATTAEEALPGGPKLNGNEPNARPEAALPKTKTDAKPAERLISPNPKGKTTETIPKRSDGDKQPEPRKGQTKNKLAMARVEFKT